MRKGLARLAQFRVVPLMFVAAVLLVGGCRAGESGPPMTLTLSAAQTCETGPGAGWAGSELRTNDQGDTERVSVYAGWFGIAETDVTWSVSGGTPPYALKIDGETRDATHDYTGASGTASVSCALKTGETFIDRREGRGYKDNPPEIGSGLKTIRATVTDNAGAKAEATVNAYMILNVESSGIKLRGGETYRVNGFLMTIPEGIDMETGDYEFSSCEGDDCEGGAFQIRNVGDGYEAWVYLGQRTGRELTRTVWLYDRPRGAGEERHPIEDKLDELVESIGRLPQISVN